MTEILYSWDGPVTLRLERFEARSGRRSWIQHRLVAQEGLPGVVALVRRSDEVLFVRQHRPAVERDLWELPRGFGEPEDAGPLHAARREVASETGLELDDLVSLGQIFPDSGILGGAVEVVTATVRSSLRDDDVRLDGEADQVRWFPMDDVVQMVATGIVVDGISLAALAVSWASETTARRR